MSGQNNSPVIIGLDLGDQRGDSMTVYNPATEELSIFVRCEGCTHWTADHLLSCGAMKLCLADDCACGRRALARFALSTAPWWPVLAADALLAYHLTTWAMAGFRVVGQ